MSAETKVLQVLSRCAAAPAEAGAYNGSQVVGVGFSRRVRDSAGSADRF